MPIALATLAWVSTAATLLATFAVLLLLLLFSRHMHRGRYNLPPGPKPWPVIGNLNLIGPLPHRSLNALSRKYGPIMRVWFGSMPVVVSSSADMAKAFLKTDDATLADRPKFTAGKYTTYNYSDITWSQYGPYWRQARRMCLMELFSAKRLQFHEYIRKQELRAFLNELFNSANKTILLKDHLSTLSLNVISRMVLGKKYLEKSQNAITSPEEFKKMLDELVLAEWGVQYWGLHPLD